MTIAIYTLGPCKRPAIRHDNGFLDRFAKRGPTVAEHLQYQWWVGQLEVAEAAQDVPFMPHNDISDALAAYRHFLQGTGSDRWFSYERYVANDPSGRATIDNAITDAQAGAWDLYRGSCKDDKGAEFTMTSSALTANTGSAAFPYPSTENWQKAIGAHNFWVCAKVKAFGPCVSPSFEMVITLHVEDMYNFNPGAADIATGIPDAANGIFEITGLAKQYLNVSQISRTVKWTGKPSGVKLVTPANPRRERQPADNQRVRNRL